MAKPCIRAFNPPGQAPIRICSSLSFTKVVPFWYVSRAWNKVRIAFTNKIAAGAKLRNAMCAAPSVEGSGTETKHRRLMLQKARGGVFTGSAKDHESSRRDEAADYGCRPRPKSSKLASHQGLAP